MKLEVVNLKKNPAYTEKWVQDQIAEDPSILGLGELIMRDKERRHANAGRLDLLLQDPDTLKRYEVEIQLGVCDESHIIRTVEYWDIERKRYPQYEHAAVIIAEDITSRFLNVIQLFNGAIPLIALKMTAYKVGDKVALTFVKVLDEISYGLVDDDEEVAEPTDRVFWEKKAKSTLPLMDELMTFLNDVEPKATLKYNKFYVGLVVDGSAMNFVSFVPQKRAVVVHFRHPKSEEMDELIESAGFETLVYDAGWKLYRVRITSSLTEEQKEVFMEMCRKCRELR